MLKQVGAYLQLFFTEVTFDAVAALTPGKGHPPIIEYEAG
jgi:hypothetical protein